MTDAQGTFHGRRIALTGSSGFVGSAVIERLKRLDATVIPLVRCNTAGPEDVPWAPDRSFQPDPRLEGLDAVIHLAGAGIASHRWTRRRKAVLRSSRVEATHYLSQALSQLDAPPRVFIQASGIGIYGDRGDEWLTESSPSGHGFLAMLAKDWESASQPLEQRGTRRVCLRIGTVLGPHGGALAKMLPAFRWGAGGRLGSGRQWMSWISLDDLVSIILHALDSSTLEGPVIATTPHPIQNVEFTKLLGKACHRWAFLPMPAWMLNLVLGEMAESLLLSSQRCQPRSLEDDGFRFSQTCLEQVLKACAQQPAKSDR